jgi:hypothetical protein
MPEELLATFAVKRLSILDETDVDEASAIPPGRKSGT